MILLLPILAVVACESYVSQAVEAQKFILRDKNGKDRAEIAMAYNRDHPEGNPFIRLLDENGNELTTIGRGFLDVGDGDGQELTSINARGITVFGEAGGGRIASLSDNDLHFESGSSQTVRLDGGTPGQAPPSLWLWGDGGKKPALVLVDKDRFLWGTP